MARYETGETLASIARTYDCSPPAISYVVSRSRARHPGTETPPKAPSTAEAQLIKAPAGEITANGNGTSPVLMSSSGNGASSADGAPPGTGQRPEAPLAQPQANSASHSDRRSESWPREANGFDRNGAGQRNTNMPGPNMPGANLPGHNTPGHNTPSLAPRPGLLPQRAPALPAPAGPADSDQRRTLHLSLGNPPQSNGGTPAEHHPAERLNFASDGQPAYHQTAGERFAPPGNPASQHGHTPPDRGRDGAGESGFSDARSAPYGGPVQRTDADVPRRKDSSSSYIDQELRARVDSDIAAFLAAFDMALVEDTQESRSTLREATDRLLRAGARTRIELERLEARIPLSSRENIGRSEPAWRHR